MTLRLSLSLLVVGSGYPAVELKRKMSRNHALSLGTSG
jgi:hypothetical protein